MMKRRWSNNGGFAALKMLEESSSEVTSSSNGLVLSSDINMSPSSLDSPVYGDQEMWLCNDSASYNNSHQHSVITSIQGCTSSLPAQTTIIPLSNNNNASLNNNQNYSNGSMNTNITSGGNNSGVPGMTTLNGLGQGVQVNSHSHNNHSHHHNSNSNHSQNSSHHTNGHMGVGGGGGGGNNGGGGGGGLSVNINGPNIVSNAQQLSSLPTQNGQIIHANIGIHSIISNGLNHHHPHHHHMNNSNNMMHHTPRSESANSISSGKFK